MKRYLLAAVVVLNVGVNAESNPFDLQKNLQKIDQDQEVLLSALKEMADKKDEFADVPEVPTAVEKTQTVPETEVKDRATDISTVEVASEEMAVETNTTSMDTTRVDTIREKLMSTEAKKQEQMIAPENNKSEKIDTVAQQKAEEERLEKVKAEQAKIEQARIKQAEAEKERLEAVRAQRVAEEQANIAAQKAAEERREVEAYEAERLAKKQAEEKLAAEAKAAEEMAKKAKEEAKHAVVDINITREELVSKQEADKAYLDAVKEMDRED